MSDQRANCRADGVDPELFFVPPSDPRTAEAKGICAWCVIREECLAGALQRHEQYGVWGGLSEKDRSELWAGKT